MKSWYSCQMDNFSIFQVKDHAKMCRSLKIDDRKGIVSQRALPSYPGQERRFFSVCKTNNMHAFILGGLSVGAKNTCMRYDMFKETWESMPPMQQGRKFLSSCSLRGYIYVIGGQNDSSQYLQTIEKLRVKESLSEQMKQVWQTIPTSNLSRYFTARIFHIASPISPT